MNVKEVLKKGIEILKTAGIEAPAADAGVILCQVLECDRAFLYAHGGDIPEEGRVQAFLEKMERRARGMPVQYITGHQEFMSLDFLVTPDVLIPRQDTEILVEFVIDFFKNNAAETGGSLNEGYANSRVLDIGTGSGCIAVSLAYYLPGVCVSAADISEKALEIARMNAAGKGVEDRIRFIRSNLFSNLPVPDSDNLFDAVVSNPPYIPSGDIKELQREVKGFEPLTALDGGADGLDFYRRITGKAPEYLRPGGLLAFEVGIGEAHEVAMLMKEAFSGIRIVKDLAGIDRVVAGRLNLT